MIMFQARPLCLLQQREWGHSALRSHRPRSSTAVQHRAPFLTCQKSRYEMCFSRGAQAPKVLGAKHGSNPELKTVNVTPVLLVGVSGSSVEVWIESGLKLDYFGQYDCTAPGSMSYNWRQVRICSCFISFRTHVQTHARTHTCMRKHARMHTCKHKHAHGRHTPSNIKVAACH